MYRSEQTFTVNAPIDVVFKNLSCLRGCVNWSSLMRTAEQLDPGPAAVGTRYRHTASFMGMDSAIVVTMTQYNPPYEWAFTDSGTGNLPVDNHYVLKEVEGGTEVRHTMTLTPKDGLIGRMTAALVAGRVQKQMAQDLETFKEMVEAGVQVHV